MLALDIQAPIDDARRTYTAEFWCRTSARSNLAIALIDQGHYDEALSHLDHALSLRNSFAQAHSNRGNALLRLKRFREAEQAYRRAIDLHPQFVDGWNNIGTVYLN